MIQFVKMHGLGNDFAIFDSRPQTIAFSRTQIAHLADRRRGIGFDQLCLLKKPRHPEANVFIEIINTDGTAVGACGNLTRCVAKLISEETGQKEVTIQTLAGLLRAEILDHGDVMVNMGKPSFHWADVPLAQDMDTMAIDFKKPNLPQACTISMGNPHCVFIVNDLAQTDIKAIGPEITNHPFFPEETNVELIKIVSRTHIEMSVWERSVGYSVACGSGACAAASVALRKGLIERKVQVDMPGGSLKIEINGQEEVYMIGPVHTSFSGNIELSLL